MNRPFYQESKQGKGFSVGQRRSVVAAQTVHLRQMQKQQAQRDAYPKKPRRYGWEAAEQMEMDFREVDDKEVPEEWKE